jgi:hypothetical protein
MGNMSYCRFQNTLADLKDCKNALDEQEFDELNSDEQHAAIDLIRLCMRIANKYGDSYLEEAVEIFSAN